MSEPCARESRTLQSDYYSAMEKAAFHLMKSVQRALRTSCCTQRQTCAAQRRCSRSISPLISIHFSRLFRNIDNIRVFEPSFFARFTSGMPQGRANDVGKSAGEDRSEPRFTM